VRPDWPRFDNVWDGFTYFSRISGKGRMILDGDFLLLSRFFNDAERQTALSLYVLAGSPLAIADYCPAPDDCPVVGGSFLDLYRNDEVLALNAQGLVGHPLDPDGPGPKRPDGERWVGQLPDGTWIVGLFNRSERPRTKRIRYRRHLGIRRRAATRDLWAHHDLGPRRSYRVTLRPHEHRLLRITAPGAS
jgi:alpha-glucosidase